MTIATEAIVSGPFDGNGVNTSFAFGFKVFTDSDVLVVHTSATGVDRVAELNTDYIVTRNADQDASPGGEITWRVSGVTVALPTNESITISSQVPYTQQTALPTGGKYAAKTVERMIDKCVVLIKQLGRSVTRSLRQPISDAVVMSELPNAANRRGRYLYFEDTEEAQPSAIAAIDTSLVAVSTFMETLLDDADAGAARATLGITSLQPTPYIEGLLDDANATAARATLEILGAGVPPNLGPAPVAGTSTQAAKSDHVHQYQQESFIIAASDETTNLATGVNKVKFRMPYAFTLTDVRASLSTAQASGALLTVDVNENGVSILSTKLTFDNNETTTLTAATPRVISDTSLADDSEISVDIDVIGDVGAKGLKVALIGRRAT